VRRVKNAQRRESVAGNGSRDWHEAAIAVLESAKRAPISPAA
jgi:hypothetical protein